MKRIEDMKQNTKNDMNNKRTTIATCTGRDGGMVTSTSRIASTLLRCVFLLLMMAGVGKVWAVDYTYVVINKSSKEAIRYTVSQSTGDAPELPKYIKSPATLTYHYYDEYSFTNDGSGNYTQNTLTAVTALPASASTIYVTYDNYTGTEFDLNRGKQYYFSWLGTDGTTKYYM